MAVSEIQAVKCERSERICLCVDAKRLLANDRMVPCPGSPRLPNSHGLSPKSKRPTRIQKWCLSALVCANVAPTLGVEAEERCNVIGIIDLSARRVHMLANGHGHFLFEKAANLRIKSIKECRGNPRE